MEIAVIWIPATIEPSEHAVATCLAHLRRHSYRFAGIIRASWETVEQAMIDGRWTSSSSPTMPTSRRTGPRIELATATDADGDQTVSYPPLG
ncbi:hypothetical protein NKG94_04480 [Micromonospora sp. M12]